ncbi:glycoside hydrolase family 19 [Aggregatibacter actinomycetemcomitans]|uniref:glycoside hydrolase family 19 protein n=1 Tax=Aggregatibacter actinomycetemcomitans TaxID=714 RepID=UPI00197BB226|nr:glycoside hydrolase family 19 [Aggregatibacter actinomycetemcomitans]MBN6069654.1 glycoside hydrolase family 19 [Aggregatibacter actinomycetemcomitans]
MTDKKTNKKAATHLNNTKTAVDKLIIPEVAYPLKAKGGIKNNLQEYFNRLKGDASSRFLFNKDGLWHQGIHLRASQFKDGFEIDKIYAIAKGRLLAYKVDSEYHQDNLNPGKSAVYSTGFFLLDHHLEYPKGNKLTFYSLYRHMAKLSEYPSSSTTILGETYYEDGKIVIKDEKNKTVEVLPNGVLILVEKELDKDKRNKVIWYKKDGVEYKPKTGRWSIYSKSYRAYAEEQILGLPLLASHKIETQVDKEVVLDKPIEIAAGTELGLMGEYNQVGESNQKLLHLELFTYDDVEAFREKAKITYKEDKKQKRVEDNFLYVDRNSPCYSITDNLAIELERTQTKIMVPLSEVEKVTLKQNNESKTYYNIMPYLYNLSSDSKGKAKNDKSGIYVDDSHLTHGILFPGMNVYKEQSNTLSIFKIPLNEYLDPNNGRSLEEKNQLNDVFKAIMQELDLEKDKGALIKFEAGKLDMMSLSPIQHRCLAGIVVKHDSEWKSTRQDDFAKVCALYRENQKVELAECIDKRVKDLSISIKVGQFDTDKQAYYVHPLGGISLFQKVGNFITMEQMLQIFPAGNASLEVRHRIQSVIDELNSDLEGYKLDTPLRKAHFFAQVRIEAGPTFRFIESLKYKEKTLIDKFSYYKARPNEARQDEYNEMAIANKVYADKNRAPKYKLGNISDGDGYKYIGRGLKQVTGKSNYVKFNNDYPKIWGEEQVNFVDTPNLLSDSPKYAVRSAIWFWLNGKLYKKADRGDTRKVVDEITALINLGTDTYDDRYNEFIGYGKIKGTYHVFKDY